MSKGVLKSWAGTVTYPQPATRLSEFNAATFSLMSHSFSEGAWSTQPMMRHKYTIPHLLPTTPNSSEYFITHQIESQPLIESDSSGFIVFVTW